MAIERIKQFVLDNKISILFNEDKITGLVKFSFNMVMQDGMQLLVSYSAKDEVFEDEFTFVDALTYGVNVLLENANNRVQKDVSKCNHAIVTDDGNGKNYCLYCTGDFGYGKVKQQIEITLN